MNRSLLIIGVILSLLHLNCKKEPPVVPPEEKPPVYQQSIFLSVADSGLTEIYLKLSITDSLLPRGFSLYRNNAQILSGSLFGKETTLVDTAAQFNSGYSYRAFRLDNSLRKDSSNTVMTKTLDTTSHEFTWTIDTIGAVGSFHTDLIDVTIVNENEIWIGGKIHVSDTSRFNLIRLSNYSVDYHNVTYIYSPTFSAASRTYAVYNFGSTNILSGSSVSVMHWNGTIWSHYPGLYISDNEFIGNIVGGLWGTSVNNLYGVGIGGSIVRWNGSNWTRMSTSTTVDLQDIAGTPDGDNLWACGSNPYALSSASLLKFTNGSWKTVWEGDPIPFRKDSISGHLTGVLVPNKNKALVLSRYGVYEVSTATNSTIRRNSFAIKEFPGFPSGIGGNRENDYFIVGALGLMAHYNGNTWKQYNVIPKTGIRLVSVKQKDNTVVIIGNILDSFNSRGIVIIGRRK